MAKKINKKPVSIITGFLGSGKTTLINALMNQPNMNDIALIINEFGEVGLDNLLVESSIENTLLLENGCICCSIRGDLIDTIIDLFTKVKNKTIPEFSRILIETTGIAEPGPIANCFIVNNVISRKCKLHNIITLVDATQGIGQLVLHKEAKIQVAQSDLCLVSKCDIGLVEEINALEDDLRKINPIAKIERIENGQISPVTLFQEPDPLLVKPHFADGPAEKGIANLNHDHITSWSFVSEKPIDKVKFKEWIKMLYTLRPYAMLRMKGVLKFSKINKPVLIQAVGNKISDFRSLDNWPSIEDQNNLTLIFTGLERSAVSASFARWVLE